MTVGFLAMTMALGLMIAAIVSLHQQAEMKESKVLKNRDFWKDR